MTSKFIIRGLVQGIGFRPYIARIGEELELTGFVRNTDGIVEVILKTSDIEAESENVKKMFLNALYSDLPANAIIDNILEVFCSKEDESLIKNNEFYIAGSVAASIQAVDECGDDSKFFTDGIDSNKSADSLDSHSIDPIPMIPVDLPMCDKCRAELFDKTNRRYMHPFISCTECGPRYSIINSIPYDRVNISMSKFPMCPECEKEYTAHGDRRRHAQTIACKNCGPRLELKVFGEENKTIKVEDSNALDG
ncbi:MAG: acylphosphatase, partial [Lachnospiraceae bacterium]|nr:acylphosphatase [Lachnospiraceae bacterium]